MGIPGLLIGSGRRALGCGLRVRLWCGAANNDGFFRLAIIRDADA